MFVPYMSRSSPRNLVSYSHHTDAYRTMVDNFKHCTVYVVRRTAHTHSQFVRLSIWLFCGIRLTYQSSAYRNVSNMYIRPNWMNENNTHSAKRGKKSKQQTRSGKKIFVSCLCACVSVCDIKCVPVFWCFCLRMLHISHYIPPDWTT